MNILVKAVETVKYTIPIELLKIAFKDEVYNYTSSHISLDERILSNIVRPRVLIDCNIVGGEMILVKLDGLKQRSLDRFSVIYEIPLELVNYRTILSVLSVGYLNGMGYGNSRSLQQAAGAIGSSSNDLLQASSRVGAAMSNIPVVSTAKANVIGNNTILLYDEAGISGLYQLRCLVSNEENLNNISTRSYLAFSNLVVYAVKAYIYNKLIVQLDNAYLVGGQELGSIKNIVESYSDAEENYQTYLNEVWRKTAFMNDIPSYDRFIKMQISPGL